MTIGFISNGQDGLDVRNTLNSNFLELDERLTIQTVQILADAVGIPTLRDGDYIQTEGYLTPGDGGGSFYGFSPTSLGTADGGSLIDVTSGGQLYNTFPGGTTNFRQWGATGLGLVLDTAPLIACLSYVQGSNGVNEIKEVTDSDYRIDQELVVSGPKPITFSGLGHNGNLFGEPTAGGTRFLWYGAADTTKAMVAIRTPESSPYKTSNHKVGGFALMGRELCGIGLNVRSTDNNTIHDIYVDKTTKTGFLYDTALTNPGVGAPDTQHNHTSNILGFFFGLATDGIVLTKQTGPLFGNTSANYFTNVGLYINTGVGLKFLASDSNVFDQVRISAQGLLSGTGVLFKEALTNPSPTIGEYARSNMIYHLFCSQLNIIAEGTTGAYLPSTDNIIIGYNLDGAGVDRVATVGPSARFAMISPRGMYGLPLVNGIALTAQNEAEANVDYAAAKTLRTTAWGATEPALTIINNHNTPEKLLGLALYSGYAWHLDIDDGTGDLVVVRVGGTGSFRVEQPMKLLNQTVTGTAPPAGAGGALPLTPEGYVEIRINGTSRKIPYYP